MPTHSQKKLRLPILRHKNTPQQMLTRPRPKRRLQRKRKKKRRPKRKSQEAGSAAYLVEESDCLRLGFTETILLHCFL